MSVIFNWIMSLFKLLFGKKKEEVISPRPDWNPDNTNIDAVEWIVENQSKDTDKNCLKVIYREKYGAELVVYCMVLFRNDKTKQYKMVAPWLTNKIIEMSNVTGIEVNEVPKTEAQI